MPKPASIAPKPNVICFGEVGEVGELQTPDPSKGGKYHSFKISLNPFQNGQKANIFLRFEPEFFKADFDPAVLEPDNNIPSRRDREKNGIDDTPAALENDIKRSRHFVYATNICSDAGDGFLEVLIGDKWQQYNEALKAAEDAGQLDAEHIRQITAQFIKGAAVIYALRQQKRDGKRSQYYEVSRLEPVTDAVLKRYDKKTFKSRTPTVITFEVEVGEPTTA